MSARSLVLGFLLLAGALPVVDFGVGAPEIAIWLGLVLAWIFAWVRSRVCEVR